MRRLLERLLRGKNYLHNVIIGDNSIIDNLSTIGEYTYIGRNCLVSKSSIGRYCSIGNNVSIGPGEHKIDVVSTSSYIYEDRVNWYNALTEKKVIIGNDVWIGTDSIIKRGVVIGDGAVVGANSFVNRDVPDFAVVVGSPAKIVRYRLNNELIKKIKEAKWWNLPLEDARKFCIEFEKTYNINSYYL